MFKENLKSGDTVKIDGLKSNTSYKLELKNDSDVIDVKTITTLDDTPSMSIDITDITDTSAKVTITGSRVESTVDLYLNDELNKPDVKAGDALDIVGLSENTNYTTSIKYKDKIIDSKGFKTLETPKILKIGVNNITQTTAEVTFTGNAKNAIFKVNDSVNSLNVNGGDAITLDKLIANTEYTLITELNGSVLDTKTFKTLEEVEEKTLNITVSDILTNSAKVMFSGDATGATFKVDGVANNTNVKGGDVIDLTSLIGDTKYILTTTLNGTVLDSKEFNTLKPISTISRVTQSNPDSYNQKITVGGVDPDVTVAIKQYGVETQRGKAGQNTFDVDMIGYDLDTTHAASEYQLTAIRGVETGNTFNGIIPNYSLSSQRKPEPMVIENFKVLDGTHAEFYVKRLRPQDRIQVKNTVTNTVLYNGVAGSKYVKFPSLTPNTNYADGDIIFYAKNNDANAPIGLSTNIPAFKTPVS